MYLDINLIQNNFTVYNGSSEVIDPIKRHTLKIKIIADSPSNFYLTNLNNQSKFTYTKPLKLLIL